MTHLEVASGRVPHVRIDARTRFVDSTSVECLFSVTFPALRSSAWHRLWNASMPSLRAFR